MPTSQSSKLVGKKINLVILAPKIGFISRRVLYSVSHSYPYSSNGYAVRTHGVAAALVRAGCSVIAATRPGVPWDHLGFSLSSVVGMHHLDDVRYLHTPITGNHSMADPAYMEKSVEIRAEQMQVFKPSVVIAGSNWHNALPTAIAARRLGLPFYYEVRGFWEISQMARDLAWEGSPGFLHEVENETAVAKAADGVFTLNRFMLEELVRRGVPRRRIALVPNGFPGFSTPNPGVLSREALGIRSRYVVGYIGSFTVYEGLEDLIHAVGRLRSRGVDVSLLLVGSSEPRGFGAGTAGLCAKTVAYKQLAESLGIANHIFFEGRVPPEQASSYYALLDAVVIPRLPLAVCELVSPMKPLEAASMGKRVLMSDVAPLYDLANLYSGFSYFEKGNVSSMAQRLGDVLQSPEPEALASQGLASYTWDNNVQPMVQAVLETSRNANFGKR